MASNETEVITENYKRVKSVLISQPKPERSPYYEIEKKYNLQIDWRPFIHVEPLPIKEFRRQKVYIQDYSAIIFTSRNSIEHFFKKCEESRVEMPQDTKYFCMSEAISNYLQKFIVYRKRKVFSGKRTIEDLKPYLLKHKAKEKFLLPCSNLGSKSVSNFLEKNSFDWKEAMMYQTVSSDLSDLADITYDILVFFSPLGIKSLYDNFPDFAQNETRLAIFGKRTSEEVERHGLSINITPSKEAPSMTLALEKYLQKSNKG